MPVELVGGNNERKIAILKTAESVICLRRAAECLQCGNGLPLAERRDAGEAFLGRLGFAPCISHCCLCCRRGVARSWPYKWRSFEEN